MFFDYSLNWSQLLDYETLYITVITQPLYSYAAYLLTEIVSALLMQAQHIDLHSASP